MLEASTSSLPEILAYAARGWPVLPVWGIVNGACACPRGVQCNQSPGKHPLGMCAPHGVKDATLDQALITKWHADHPSANWAIATGRELEGGGFLVVLDVDPRNQGDETLASLLREHGELPDTARAQSGGNGQHYLFRSPVAMGGAVLGEGIEFKAAGGYILVAPSLHYSGRRYAWDAGGHPDETPIVELPAWLRERLASRGRERPNWTGVDARNSMLGEAFSLAGWLGELLGEGKRKVRCPWENEHSDSRGRGDDSSAVLLPPTPTSSFGGFKCLHSHCQTKGWKEVLAALPGSALQQARAKFRPKPADAKSDATPHDADGVVETADWKLNLLWKTKKDGGTELERHVANVVGILRHDPRWVGRVRFDLFGECVRVTGAPWHPDDSPSNSSGTAWTDEDDVRLAMWLKRFWGLDMSIQDVSRGVTVAAQGSAYHEVRDYLSALTWDGSERVDGLFVDYFGAPDDDYSRGVGLRWMVAAVARVMVPGCKADYLPVLEGIQGLGKSSGLRALTGESWFYDSALPIGDKDAYQALNGKWIIELAELDSFSRADLNKVKAFLTAQSDHYRGSYGRRAVTHLRQCVFAGTTNEKEYLKDPTGARRFWPVRCSEIDVPGLRRDRDQLWAEAVTLFRKGQAWHPDRAFEILCVGEQGHRFSAHAWEEPIEAWLGVRGTIGVTTYEVLTSALNIEKGRITRGDEMQVASILRRLGYEKRREQQAGVRERKYYSNDQPGQPVDNVPF